MLLLFVALLVEVFSIDDELFDLMQLKYLCFVLFLLVELVNFELDEIHGYLFSFVDAFSSDTSFRLLFEVEKPSLFEIFCFIFSFLLFLCLLLISLEVEEEEEDIDDDDDDEDDDNSLGLELLILPLDDLFKLFSLSFNFFS